MAVLKNSLVGLRNDPKLLLKLPPYLSLLCILIGLLWLLILPLDEYSRRGYISENALLPGQVNTYFDGSEHDVFRAYRHEVAALYNEGGEEVAARLGAIFKSQGLKVARQRYSYHSAGRTISGHNVYAILQGPRADATEALVLIAGWRNMDNIINQSGVALVLTLARYFHRWSLWSKDVIFVITEDSVAGPQAWVDAYHSTHNPALVDDLPLKSGALQGALALDYTAGPGGHRFDKIHIIYDGVNGQLPNLDLFNSVVQISSGHMGMRCTIQRMWNHNGNYKDRLQAIFRGMLTQGLGHATGPHSSFIPYHVDAITLQTVGDGWHDEMSLGRLVESTFRSLNNLLEHLHQSFFLYLLMQAERFVSIGTYLPSAMLIAVNFSIMSIALWVQSGRVVPAHTAGHSMSGDTGPREIGIEILEKDGLISAIPRAISDTSKRKIFFAVSFIGVIHLLGLIPLYIFNTMPESSLGPAYYSIAVLSNAFPYFAAYVLQKKYSPSSHTLTLIPCLSLLVLGVALATLSTLNFPLGFLVGLLASPLTFVSPISASDPSLSIASLSNSSSALKRLKSVKLLFLLALHIVSPMNAVLLLAVGSTHGSMAGATYNTAIVFVLHSAAQAWNISGTWTSVVVWLVWWPAWLTGVTLAASRTFWSPSSHDGRGNASEVGKRHTTVPEPADADGRPKKA